MSGQHSIDTDVVDMEAGVDADTAPQPYSQTAAQHIRELSELNKQVPAILHSSAKAISLCTNRPLLPPSTNPDTLSDPAVRVQLIESQTKILFTHLNTLRVQLHSQVALLRQSKVIPAEATRFIASKPQDFGGNMSEEERKDMERLERIKNPDRGVTNGGLGDLDVADLNARAGISGREGVGEDVLERVERCLSELVTRFRGDASRQGVEEMDIDNSNE